MREDPQGDSPTLRQVGVTGVRRGQRQFFGSEEVARHHLGPSAEITPIYIVEATDDGD